jgi:hypothetical protein
VCLLRVCEHEGWRGEWGEEEEERTTLYFLSKPVETCYPIMSVRVSRGGGGGGIGLGDRFMYLPPKPAKKNLGFE